MNPFSPYHLAFIRALIQHNVRFLITGGKAAIYYGVRRNTGDLDILLEPSADNGKNVLRAFTYLGLSFDNLKPEEFEQPLFLSVGFEPDAVDLLTITPGIDFTEAYKRAEELKIDDLKVNLISIDDLILNKSSLRREGEKRLLDEYDVEVLKRLKKDQSDKNS